MPRGENIYEELKFITVQNKNPIAVAKAFSFQVLHASDDPPPDLPAAPNSPGERFNEATWLCINKHVALPTKTIRLFLATTAFQDKFGKCRGAAATALPLETPLGLHRLQKR
jgi:hypothetical protein